MLDVEFKIEGAEALRARMKAVGYDIRYKGGRFALRKAANLVAKSVKENAARLDDPKTAERIADNVAVRWNPRLFKASGDLGFRVGIMGGAGSKQKGKAAKGGDTTYWRFIEFGTQKMAARPFIRPALEMNAGAATQEFARQSRKAIERAVKKAAKASGV